MTPADTAIAAAGQFVNLHEFDRYWALMVLTGHWGGWPYAPDPQPVGANAGTYADPTTHQLYFIPEGINDAFSTADFDFITHVKSVLAATCASSSSCFQDFAAQLNELVGTATQLNWSGEMQRVAAQIASYVAMDPQEALQQRRRRDVPAAGRLFHDWQGAIRRQVPGGARGDASALT